MDDPQRGTSGIKDDFLLSEKKASGKAPITFIVTLIYKSFIIKLIIV